MSYEIFAVRYASRDLRLAQIYSRYFSYREEDGPQVLDFFFWVLRDDDSVIVVDTGFARHPGERRGAHMRCTPAEAVESLGFAPAEVETVIITHFHYDHVGNLGLYSNATVVVPARELEFWRTPMAGRHLYAEHVEEDELSYIYSLDREKKIRPYKGPEELMPGVEAIELRGHAPGQHGLLVEGRSGRVLLSSDAVHLYEELEKDRVFSVVVDLEGMYRSFDTVRGLQADGALLVPAHDPEVARRFPALDADPNVFRIENRDPS